MTHNRRIHFRVPESRLVTEFSKNVPFAAGIVNLSHEGMFTVKPCEGIRTPSGIVQVEIPVPEASESIWASAEVMYETHSLKSVGTGLQFRGMARSHRTLLRDLVEQGRRRVLAQMLEEIQWRKELARYPTLFSAPPPPVCDRTVPMFRMSDLAR